MFKFYFNENALIIRCVFILLFIFPFKNLKSQNHHIKTIDSLIEASKTERRNGDYLKFLAKQNIILRESKKINYSKGIAMANRYIGSCYQKFSDCGTALSFYNKALKETYTQTDFNLQSEIITNIGNCYRQQNLYKDALEKYRSAIRIGERSEENINFIKSTNYTNIGVIHQALPTSKDSAYYYYSKAHYYFLKDFKSKRIREKTASGAVICINIGEIWKNNNRLDSTKYYFHKAILYNNEAKDAILSGSLEYRIGALYYKTKDLKKADYHIEKAKTIFEEKRDIHTLPEIYALLSELNKKVGNEEKSAKYRDLLISINAKVNAAEESARMATVDNVIKDKKEVFNKTKIRLYLIIGCVLIITLIVSMYALYFHKSMKRKKQSIISDSAKQIEEKKIIIEQKDMETKELQRKVNESFEEVVKLSKENSPEFLIRFQEVYQDYYQKLINIEPKLLTTEIKLCAMIYLGFSTKDIAEYTFVTIKAVQHRKFRLRKKLSIPSDADINVWLKENY